MRLGEYIKDRSPALLARCIWLVAVITLMFLFDIPGTFQITFLVLYGIVEIAVFVWDFLRRKKFYDTLFMNLERLDKKYLVLETVREPLFYDGKLLCQILYETNKSMCENVNQYKKSVEDFKEYIEMWVHEVKLPLASLRLMCHNHKDSIDKRYVEQIRKIDNYTEQVLYFVRSEHAEKDFLIKEVELSRLIRKAVLNHKDDLIENAIEVHAEKLDTVVLSDGKWMEFILNQIVNNAIKYRDAKKESYIRITAEDFPDRTVLRVEDNGIGIAESDLSRVFEKSFTGENGRIGAKSTGMGLYISRKLCASLGHLLNIESQKGQYTIVSITFAKNDYYKM